MELVSFLSTIALIADPVALEVSCPSTMQFSEQRVVVSPYLCSILTSSNHMIFLSLSFDRSFLSSNSLIELPLNCVFTGNIGYLACARCAGSGALIDVEPVAIVGDNDSPLSPPKAQRCPTCSGAAKVSIHIHTNFMFFWLCCST